MQMRKIYIIYCAIVLPFFLTAQKRPPLGELLIHSTSKLNCTYSEIDSNGSAVTYDGSGTAFYYTFLVDSFEIPCLVTNKHVIKDAVFGNFTVTKAGPDSLPSYGEWENLFVGDFENQWILHPDPDVDLCILPIAPYLTRMMKMGSSPYCISVDQSIVPVDSIWNKFQVLEEVTMVGYPNGVHDEVNNVPIVRVGQTATPLKLPFNGREEFMLNIPSIPGSSGSPVFLFNEGTYITEGGINFGSRMYFLGVLYAGPILNVSGRGSITIDNIPVSFHTSTGITINLGMCIKSTEMDGFLPLLKKIVDD